MSEYYRCNLCGWVCSGVIVPRACFKCGAEDLAPVPPDDPVLDECACGDLRFEHPDNGPCKYNGLGHHIPEGFEGNICNKFRLASGLERR
ncbi:MAG: hypothetical protein AB1631_19825 [Acidobacteriota bacterium]